MTELEYWKLKARLADLRTEEMQLRYSLNEVESRKLALMTEHGLEANTPYRFNDKEFTIEKIDGK